MQGVRRVLFVGFEGWRAVVRQLKVLAKESRQNHNLVLPRYILGPRILLILLQMLLNLLNSLLLKISDKLLLYLQQLILLKIQTLVPHILRSIDRRGEQATSAAATNR